MELRDYLTCFDVLQISGKASANVGGWGGSAAVAEKTIQDCSATATTEFNAEAHERYDSFANLEIESMLAEVQNLRAQVQDLRSDINLLDNAAKLRQQQKQQKKC